MSSKEYVLTIIITVLLQSKLHDISTVVCKIILYIMISITNGIIDTIKDNKYYYLFKTVVSVCIINSIYIKYILIIFDGSRIIRSLFYREILD